MLIRIVSGVLPVVARTVIACIVLSLIFLAISAPVATAEQPVSTAEQVGSEVLSASRGGIASGPAAMCVEGNGSSSPARHSDDARLAQDTQHALIMEVLHAAVQRLGPSQFRVSREGAPVAGIHPYLLYGISAMDGRSDFIWLKAYASEHVANASFEADRARLGTDTDPFHGHQAYTVRQGLFQWDWVTQIGRFRIELNCNSCEGPWVDLAEALWAEGEPRKLFMGGPIVLRVSADGYVEVERQVDNSDLAEVVAISGAVTAGASGEPVEGASVEIVGGANNVAATTDGNGAYSITAIVQGGSGERAVGGVDFQLQSAVDEIILTAEPDKIGVDEPGDYATSISATVLDDAGQPIPGLTPTFSVDSGGGAIDAVLDPVQQTTDEYGAVYYQLYVSVRDLGTIPASVTVRAEDQSSGVVGQLQVQLEPATFAVEITDPADGLETESDRVTIRGNVTGVDPGKVGLNVNVMSDGNVDFVPAADVDASGSFSFEVGLLTPSEPYTIEVVGQDDLGNSHADSVTVTFMGWAVEIQEIAAPESVSPGQPYDVSVKVRYSVPEAWTVDVGAWSNDLGQRDSRESRVGPGVGDLTFLFSFVAPANAPALAADALHQPAPGGSGSFVIDVNANLRGRNNGSVASTEIWIKPGLEVRASFYTWLPYPEESKGDRLDYGTLTYDEWAVHKHARRTTGLLIRNKGINFTFTFMSRGAAGNLSVACDRPQVVGAGGSIDWPDRLKSFTLTPSDVHLVELNAQLKGLGHPQTGWPPARVSKYWVSMTCSVTDGTTTETLTLRDWFLVGNPKFEMKVTTLQNTKHRQISWPKPGSPLLGQRQGLAAASETIPLSADKQIDGRWLRIGGDAGPAQVQGVASSLVEALTHMIYFPIVSKPIGPVRIVLDWPDPSVDVDLHVYDPNGRSLGGVYGYGIVRNNIPGAYYGGNDTKPEWVTLYDPVPGDYLLVAYAPVTSGTIVAEMSVDGYLGEAKPDQPTATTEATSMATPVPATVTPTTTLPVPVTEAPTQGPTATLEPTQFPMGTTAVPPTAATPGPSQTSGLPTVATPSQSATPEATPQPTLEPTREPTLEPTPTASPSVEPVCEDVIVNGDFEQGLSGWELDDEVNLRFGDFGGGRYAAMLTGRNNSKGTLSQEVTIPADATSVHVTYWWRVESGEPTGGTIPYDLLHVLSPLSPDTSFTWETVSNVSPREKWMPSGYVALGATGPFEIVFEGESSPQNPTEFFVDDVRLVVCTGAVPTMPSASVEPSSGGVGSQRALNGSGFVPDEAVSAWVLDTTRMRWDVVTQPASAQGTFQRFFDVRAGWNAGDYSVGLVGHEGLLPAEASFTVTGAASADRRTGNTKMR